MASRNKKSVRGALDEVLGKPGSKAGRVPQDCGDIGLRIARDGTWYYQNSAIERKPLVKLFASVLRREDDGRYCLVTPVEKVQVEVEDAPFLAVALEVEGRGRQQRLTFRTNIGDLVEAGAEHPFSFRSEKDGSFTPFILVRDRLQARIARPVYYELVAAAVTEVRGGARELGVWSGGIFFPFPAPGGADAD
jgi:uncharacterized protein